MPQPPARRRSSISDDDEDSMGEEDINETMNRPDVWITPLSGDAVSNAVWKVKRVWAVDEINDDEEEHSVHNTQLFQKIKSLVGAPDSPSCASSPAGSTNRIAVDGLPKIPSRTWHVQTVVERNGKLDDLEPQKEFGDDEFEENIQHMAEEAVKEIDLNNKAIEEAKKRIKMLKNSDFAGKSPKRGERQLRRGLAGAKGKENETTPSDPAPTSETNESSQSNPAVGSHARSQNAQIAKADNQLHSPEHKDESLTATHTTHTEDATEKLTPTPSPVSEKPLVSIATQESVTSPTEKSKKKKKKSKSSSKHQTEDPVSPTKSPRKSPRKARHAIEECPSTPKFPTEDPASATNTPVSVKKKKKKKTKETESEVVESPKPRKQRKGRRKGEDSSNHEDVDYSVSPKRRQLPAPALIPNSDPETSPGLAEKHQETSSKDNNDRETLTPRSQKKVTSSPSKRKVKKIHAAAMVHDSDSDGESDSDISNDENPPKSKEGKTSLLNKDSAAVPWWKKNAGASPKIRNPTTRHGVSKSKTKRGGKRAGEIKSPPLV